VYARREHYSRGRRRSAESLAESPVNRGFEATRRAFGPFDGAFSASYSQKCVKNAIFRRFSLYNRVALPYDRIDREELKHFRIVLFYPIPPWDGRYAKYSSGIKRSQEILDG